MILIINVDMNHYGLFKCKKSNLIDKYNLTKLTDLYKLLRYGTEDYPSLFEEDNIKNDENYVF